MPIIEIDETELLDLRKLRGVASRIMAHPEGKKLLEKAHKLADPSAITPALDQEAALTEPVNKALERVQALEDEIKTDRAERAKTEKLAALDKQVEDGVNALRRDGWQDDGIEAVRKLMNEEGILDPAIAAAYIEKKHPPQLPAAPSGHGAWGFLDNVQDGEADLKKLIDSKGENNPLIDKMARDALNEVRGQGRR